MRKSFVLAFVLVLLVSFAWGGNANMTALAETPSEGEIKVEFSDVVDIFGAGAGVKAGPFAEHGGHQMRIVHTSHGDYAAYITDSVPDPNPNRAMDQFSIIRINNDGTTEVVFQEYKVYDSSQVSIFADKDENVWAVTVGDNKLKEQFDGRDPAIYAAAYKVDKKTGETTGYNIMISRGTTGGYGYSSFCYDAVNNKIYTLTASGDRPGELIWLIFDIETLTWDSTPRSIPTDFRQEYPFIYADGKGGMFFVNESAYKCISAGYPEIGSNYGLTEEELASFDRWGSDYVWDQLELYYIPDVYKEEFHKIIVEEADYSRVKGTQEERYTLAFRKTNEYPIISNNRGGDAFLDSSGYLHVILHKEFALCAYTRDLTESIPIHSVFDISDPSNMKKVYSEKLEINSGYSFDMYQDSHDNLYLITNAKINNEWKLALYIVKGSPEDGYTYDLLSTAPYSCGTTYLGNNRSNSLEDDKIAVLFSQNGDYDYAQIRLTNEEQATEEPTEQPTEEPTEQPTEEPTEQPTEQQTEEPSEQPTEQSTEEPSVKPTEKPSDGTSGGTPQTPSDKPTKPTRTSDINHPMVWYFAGGIAAIIIVLAGGYRIFKRKEK